MQTYQPYLDFTAQSHNVSALMRLYSQLESPGKPPLTAIVVFTAFAIEAYINAVGAKNITFWDDIERLPWRKKIEILHKNAGHTTDWGKEPLQFAIEVFKIRDNLAHGKPERVLGPVCTDEAEADEYLSSAKLKPDWYRIVTTDWATSALGRFRALMAYLGQLYGHHPSDHLLHASGGVLVGA